MKRKGLALISGGLDSFLAAALLKKRQKINVKGIYFFNGFEPGSREGSKFDKVTNKTWLETEVKDVSKDFLKVIRDPNFGYGSSVNPCIDCRIFMLKEAKKEMKKEGAEFLITGEVVGQRPMSQNRQSMDLVEERSGLSGRIVRPLSAKLLPPTIPEKKGLIDRDKLLDIEGRSRKRQLKLADELGLEEYDQPAGGCLLTDDNFERRVKDLWNREGSKEASYQEMMLLKYGRHFRLPEGSKAIIGRDEQDNKKIDDLSEGFKKMGVVDHPSPLTLISPEASKNEIRIAGKLTAKYSKAEDEEVKIFIESENEISEFKIKNGETEKKYNPCIK